MATTLTPEQDEEVRAAIQALTLPVVQAISVGQVQFSPEEYSIICPALARMLMTALSQNQTMIEELQELRKPRIVTH